MGWILPTIGTKMESIRVEGFRGTVKRGTASCPGGVEPSLAAHLGRFWLGRHHVEMVLAIGV